MSQLNEGASSQLKRRLEEIECDIVRAISDDEDWLPHHSQAALRWAMSLARISKVRIDAARTGLDVGIGHASDRYRAELFAILSLGISALGRVEKGILASHIRSIEELTKNHRHDLLRLFGSSLPAKALDEATRRRPLALALSGGGGTGFVFAGAFAALEDAHITPSALTGSSMGAVLGAYRARVRDFSFDALDALIEKTSWSHIAQPFSGASRFGLPATFRLYLRDTIGHEFESQGRFLCLKDLAIPLRVCVAGLISAASPKAAELEYYAHLLDGAKIGPRGISSSKKSIISLMLDFAQKPLKAIYLGRDLLTKDFDVLDAIGFSASIPGIFHYDIMRDDPRMISLAEALFKREGISRLIDGGFVDNLPASEAIRIVQDGECGQFDPFVLCLDSFSPGVNRHILFYPLMRLAAENSREGHEVAHLSVIFKNVLSPINLVPSREMFKYAVHNGYREFSPHIPFIRKMVGPIPDPIWLKL